MNMCFCIIYLYICVCICMYIHRCSYGVEHSDLMRAGALVRTRQTVWYIFDTRKKQWGAHVSPTLRYTWRYLYVSCLSSHGSDTHASSGSCDQDASNTNDCALLDTCLIPPRMDATSGWRETKKERSKFPGAIPAGVPTCAGFHMSYTRKENQSELLNFQTNIYIYIYIYIYIHIHIDIDI
jgi:hypothetical protein